MEDELVIGIPRNNERMQICYQENSENFSVSQKFLLIVITNLLRNPYRPPPGIELVLIV